MRSLLKAQLQVVEAPPGRWSLTDTDLEYLPLSKLTFTVVDVETTGTSPPADRITELAACRVKGGRIVERFSSLVNPQKRVPGPITRLTGITTAMVRWAPSSAVVLKAFRRFLGRSVFVAHNVSFDWAFVDHELRLATKRGLECPALCTLLLSRRLYPTWHGHGLEAAAEKLGIKIASRHRAWADAEAAARLLVKFLRLLGDRDVDALAEVRIFLKTGNILAANSHFSFALLRALPTSTGVYLCYDVFSKPIYIGAAENIRREAYALFQAQNGLSNRLRQLLRRVATVRVQPTSSLEAAQQRATDLIERHRPRFNSAQRRGVS